MACLSGHMMAQQRCPPTFGSSSPRIDGCREVWALSLRQVAGRGPARVCLSHAGKALSAHEGHLTPPQKKTIASKQASTQARSSKQPDGSRKPCPHLSSNFSSCLSMSPLGSRSSAKKWSKSIFTGGAAAPAAADPAASPLGSASPSCTAASPVPPPPPCGMGGVASGAGWVGKHTPATAASPNGAAQPDPPIQPSPPAAAGYPSLPAAPGARQHPPRLLQGGQEKQSVF